VDRPEEELRRIFAFLDLDPEKYDWGRALSQPVRGSSSFKPEGAAEALTWAPVQKTSSFDPNTRFAAWSPRQHARFNHVAGHLLSRFGYERKEVPIPPGGWLVDWFLDVQGWVRVALTRVWNRVRHRAQVDEPKL
jgi:hypothetical protein